MRKFISKYYSENVSRPEINKIKIYVNLKALFCLLAIRICPLRHVVELLLGGVGNLKEQKMFIFGVFECNVDQKFSAKNI